ncbi:MAG TPA: SDR family NAD(P)-dependent oxidoreductase [Alphaproteobacteria bacterium]|nr:SDR family NAD(P)-dependent oxidoreductase [Alphaproteobacteria bacterium]
MSAFKDKYGPWALVVGGSEGIGSAFARKLAERGLNLVLVARKPGPLEEVAAQIRMLGVEVHTLPVDISEPRAALQEIRKITDPLEIGFLLYMAGANLTRGVFPDVDLNLARKVVAMNVDGQMEFTHHYAGRMKARGQGGVVLAGSLAGCVGSPMIAHYSASKAFSRIFSEAIWFELKPFGVDVLHLNINFTATPAMVRLGYDVSTAEDPEAVAEEGIQHVADGPVWVVGGKANQDEALRRTSQMPRSEAVASVVLPLKK